MGSPCFCFCPLIPSPDPRYDYGCKSNNFVDEVVYGEISGARLSKKRIPNSGLSQNPGLLFYRVETFAPSLWFIQLLSNLNARLCTVSWIYCTSQRQESLRRVSISRKGYFLVALSFFTF